jgi:hypothetical protein
MKELTKIIEFYINALSGDASSPSSQTFIGLIGAEPLTEIIQSDKEDLIGVLGTTLASTGMPDPGRVADAQAQLEKDPFVTNIDITNAGSGQQLVDELGLDPNINTFLSSTTFSMTPFENPDSFYTYEVSLLDGDLNVVLAPEASGLIEVGAGGTATIVGGTDSELFLWNDKNVIWEDNSGGNAIDFAPELGSGQGAATQGLVLNLLTGEGINPFGGTLQISGVDNVQGAGTSEYIVANNNGDQIDASLLSASLLNGVLHIGTAVLIGGTGNDVLEGAFNENNLIVAGSGTSMLDGGDVNDIFSYNRGVDTINLFLPAESVFSGQTASVLDLTALDSVTSFAEVMADAAQVGDNVVFTFGADESVTLDNVTLGDLTAANFVFTPIVAFVAAPSGAVTEGEVVPITLTVSDAVTVNTANGTPTLTLNDGGVAIYNAAASDPAGLLLVFDYTVGNTDATNNLEITGVNNNGAVIVAAGGQALNVSGAVDTTLGLQVGTPPLTVSSVALSVSGEADTGTDVNITLQMNGAVSVDLGHQEGGEATVANEFGLQLSDGAFADYNAGLSSPSSGELVFTDTVATGDHSTGLSITGVLELTLSPGLFTETTVQNSAGDAADFAGALVSTGLAINPPVYVGSISADAAASPTGFGEEADTGQTFQITLSLNEGVTLNTANGTPSLSLSDGGTATFDAAASTPATGALVFDDIVGASASTPNLEISGVQLNGATIQNASGLANFSDALDTSIGIGVQINPSPLSVTSVSAQTVNTDGYSFTYITLTMSQTISNPDFGSAAFVLNNGDIAILPDTLPPVGSDQLTFSVDGETDDANVSIVGIYSGINDSFNNFQDSLVPFTDAAGFAADFTNALNVPTGVTIGDPLFVTSLTTSSADGESQGGQPVVITAGMSEAVMIAGGTLSLTLNDGGTAAYDAAASTLSSGVVAFSYTPPAGEEFSSLGINSVNLNGASVTDGSGNTADFSALVGAPLQLQIGPSTVVTAASTVIGNLAPGTSTNFILVMSQNVLINTAGGTPTLTLSNGGTATYDAALTATTASDGPNSVGQIVFDYTAGSSGAGELSIVGLNLNGAVITDVQSGLNADFSAVSSAFLGVTVSCFAQGTRMATALGEVAVEDLAVGDEMRLAGGGLGRIVWLGHRRVDCRRHPRPETVWPVQVSAGAFAPGVPARPLYLSPDHAVFCDGILVPIKWLANGVTIVQERRDQVTYWHLELERHNVLLAEGLPCESYLETGGRTAFAGDVMQIVPEFERVGCELVWEAAGCAPLRIAGPEVERIDARLRRRAGLKRTARRRTARDAGTADLMQLLRPDWYLQTNPDVAAAGVNAAAHYERWGRREGRLPCREVALVKALGLVDALTAVITMQDVAAAGVEFATHFCEHGWRENRHPNFYFDAKWYGAQAEAPPGMNPLLHYVLVGELQGLTPSRHFAPEWYRQRYGLAESICVLAHYLQHRRKGWYSPLPEFDVFAHGKAHEVLTDRDPYAHYLCQRQAVG